MILIIDNYDSFTYNLYQLFGSLNPDIKVIRNDKIEPEEVLALDPEALILSPGPGNPDEAGNLLEIIKAAAGKIPMLGICLGHQAICQVYGAVIKKAQSLMHGKASLIDIDTSDLLFAGLNPVERCGRYHSLAAFNLPEELEITALCHGEIMAVRHRSLPVYGIQFHPESILTEKGNQIAANFLNISKTFRKDIL